jgi:hypothetical protein
MNHFQGAKSPVSIQSTPYDSSPEVIGLAFPIDHMMGMMTACSPYVKNMDMMIRNAGTIQASARPSKNRTTKREAKLVQGAWRRIMQPLSHVNIQVTEIYKCKYGWGEKGSVPDDQIPSKPLPNGISLQGPVLRPLGYQVSQIKNRRKPVVLSRI